MKNSLDIIKYTAFFHDGSLLDIHTKENNVFLFLKSAEINPLEINEQGILSKSNRLVGCLSLINVKFIKENDQILNDPLKKHYKNGEILEFEIEHNRVSLLIEWQDPSIDFFTQEVSEIEIEAEKIYWENNKTEVEKNQVLRQNIEQKMNILNYTAFFHDGSLIDIKHFGNNIDLVIPPINE